MKFESKSNILKSLKKSLKKSKIEKIYDFTIIDWEKNSTYIVDKIANDFNSKIIIRSSAIGEDSIDESGAGNYESILFVNPKSKKQVINAINEVINSYKFKGNLSRKNQIIIQKQTLDSISME